MASGRPRHSRPPALLDAIAGKVYRLGDRAGIGSTVKMVNQHLAGVHIAAAARRWRWACARAPTRAQLYDVICNSAGMSWMFQNRVPHILDGDYTPLSAVNIFVKDLGIVLDGRASLPSRSPSPRPRTRCSSPPPRPASAREDDRGRDQDLSGHHAAERQCPMESVVDTSSAAHRLRRVERARHTLPSSSCTVGPTAPRTWNDVAARLAEPSYRVIAPALRGFARRAS